MNDSLLERLGRRFSRFVTDRVVARPSLWRLFRGTMRRQFDHMAPEWETRRGPEALAPLSVALDRVSPPRRALDLGTGTGKAARMIAERFPEAEIVGVDLSPAMIEQAKQLLPADFEGRVRFEIGDASKLPFPDGTFDLVVLLNMIPFFDELSRVIAAGGSVVFAFFSGPATPIYVEPSALRKHLAPLGFGEFEELAAGTGTSFVARRRADETG